MEALRQKEKRILLNKIRVYVGKKLTILTGAGGTWTQKEIMDISGVGQNRVSETINYEEKRAGGIGWLDLQKLLEAGREILTVNEIKENVRLSEKEKTHIEGFKIFENLPLKEKLLNLMNAGIDPLKIIELGEAEFYKRGREE